MSEKRFVTYKDLAVGSETIEKWIKAGKIRKDIDLQTVSSGVKIYKKKDSTSKVGPDPGTEEFIEREEPYELESKNQS